MNCDTNTDFRMHVEEADGRRILRVCGELCLANLGMLRDGLKEQLQTEQTVCVDAAAITAVDLPGLQLLCSAHRTYRRAGAQLELQARPEVLRQAAACAGYDAGTSICPFRDHTCLWSK